MTILLRAPKHQRYTVLTSRIQQEAKVNK